MDIYTLNLEIENFQPLLQNLEKISLNEYSEQNLKEIIVFRISEEELQVTKTNSKANFLRNNETKNIRSITIAYFEALGVGYNFINNYFSEIDATTLEEFNDYIKEVLDPKKGISITVGPKAQ